MMVTVGAVTMPVRATTVNARAWHDRSRNPELAAVSGIRQARQNFQNDAHRETPVIRGANQAIPRRKKFKLVSM